MQYEKRSVTYEVFLLEISHLILIKPSESTYSLWEIQGTENKLSNTKKKQSDKSRVWPHL